MKDYTDNFSIVYHIVCVCIGDVYCHVGQLITKIQY